MAKVRAKLSDQLRAAIDASEMSRYAVCKALGVDQGLMSRFMAGKAGLSMETIDMLADLLGLKLVGGQAKPAATTKPTTGNGR